MRRQRAQSVVEFGGVIVFLTLLIAAVIDFGLLMDQWLTVASDTRELAREAAVGVTPHDLAVEASDFKIYGVTTDNGAFPAYCCDPGDALVLTVTYYNQCLPTQSTCHAVDTGRTDSQGLDDRYGGHCDHNTYQCQHPARPSPSSTATCNPGLPLGPPYCQGDSVQITFSASRAHMLTPILQGMCNPNGAACLTLQNTVTMRFDGVGLH